MGKPVRAGRTLPGEIRKDRSIVKAQVNRSPYFQTGMHPNGNGGLDSDNFDDTHGYSFKDDGDAEFNGNVDIGGTLNVTGNTVIGGTLSLPAGIIDNDALANPVSASVHKCAASSFSLTPTDTEKAGVDITIPAGFTKAQAVLSGRLYAVNPNTTGGPAANGNDALYVNVGLAGNYSTATPTEITGSNGFATTTCDDTHVLTGLTPGATIRLSVTGASAYQTIAVSSDNFISATASISWLR